MTRIQDHDRASISQALREDAEACNARLREKRDGYLSNHPNGLNRTDIAVLDAFKKADKPIRTSHAARIAGIEPAHASHVVKKLQRMGRIEEAGRDPTRMQVKLYKAVRMAQ